MKPNGSRHTRAVNTRGNKNNEPMADKWKIFRRC